MPPTDPKMAAVPEKPAPSRIVGRLIISLTLLTAVVVGIITLSAGRRMVEQRKAKVAPTNPVVTPAPAPAPSAPPAPQP
jgi:hypothetical protein